MRVLREKTKNLNDSAHGPTLEAVDRTESPWPTRPYPISSSSSPRDILFFSDEPTGGKAPTWTWIQSEAAETAKVYKWPLVFWSKRRAPGERTVGGEGFATKVYVTSLRELHQSKIRVESTRRGARKTQSRRCARIDAMMPSTPREMLSKIVRFLAFQTHQRTRSSEDRTVPGFPDAPEDEK